MQDMGLWLAIAVIALTIGSLVGRIVWLAHVKRKRARNRHIEAPNSHYTPQLVRNREDLDRWEAIPLEKVHEINRGEVRQLIDKAKAAGVESLRPRERQFLDHMALVTGPDRGPDGAPLRKEAAAPARPQQPPRPPDLMKPSEARS
jgi:hypothetical protein